jgi:uncharacterized protein YabE (DUF348 family)
MQFLLKHKNWLIATSILLFVGIGIGFLLINKPTYHVNIWVDNQSQPITLQTNLNTPAAILTQAHITLSAENRVLVNGQTSALNQPINNLDHAVIQVRHAHRIDLNVDGKISILRSSALTLGQALWENNLIFTVSDFITPPLDTALDQDLQVTIRRSQLLRIQIQGQEINLPSAAQTVGDALAQAGVSLQNLDYSIPAGNDPLLPVDRTIKVVRVREEIQLQSTPIPFTSEMVADPQAPIDTQKVIQIGQYGLEMARVRVRFEDGKETSRQTESKWMAKSPVSQKMAYGTLTIIQTLSTQDGTIEYWRALSVFITSYKDTGSRTASGKWPTYGDIAVNPTWYKCLKGTRFYIPGYGFGTIDDVCPGCVGKPWIDVFIPTSEYKEWHTTEMIYFLIPQPANFQCTLQ